MRRLVVALVLGGAIFAEAAPGESGGAAAAGSPERGREKARNCMACHGIDGIARIPMAPSIAGEDAGYLARQLTAFRDGERVQQMMTVVTAGLTDGDIRDLAAWYASRPVHAVLPAGADPARAPEACVACHGMDGLATIPDAPHIAGENHIYLEFQIKAFREGLRRSEVMEEIARALGEEELRAAAGWYGAIALEIAEE